MELNIEYKSPRHQYTQAEGNVEVVYTPEAQVRGCLQVGFCLMIAEDCIRELYYSELRNDTTAKCRLLECKQTIQGLWRSIRTKLDDDHGIFMMEVGEVVDDYDTRLHSAFNEMRVSNEKWNNYIVKYYGMYVFLIAASTALYTLYKKDSKRYKSAITEAARLYSDVIRPIAEAHGVLDKVTEEAYYQPLVDFIYDVIEPATLKIAGNILQSARNSGLT